MAVRSSRGRESGAGRASPVRPVDVLEDRQPSARSRCLERGRETSCWGRRCRAQLLREVEEGPQGLRREEPVAGSPEEAGSSACSAANVGRVRSCRTRLAADQDQPAVTGGRSVDAHQSGEISPALDELHAEMLTRCAIARYYAVHGTCPGTQVPLAAAARHRRVLRAGSPARRRALRLRDRARALGGGRPRHQRGDDLPLAYAPAQGAARDHVLA